MAGVVFKQQLFGKTVVIGDSQYNNPSKHVGSRDRMSIDFVPSSYKVAVDNLKNYVELSKMFTLKEIPKVLKYFGRFVSKMYVIHDLKIPGVLSRPLFGSINLYCSDTLVELNILSKSDVFQKFKLPFKQLQYVSLNGWFDQFKNESITFATVFPAMRQLTLSNLYLEKIGILNHNYPKLKHITSSCQWTDDRTKFDEYRLWDVIKLNQQLKKLSLWSARPSSLVRLAEVLPHVENLELFEYRGWDRNRHEVVKNITFENLRKLSVPSDSSFDLFIALPKLSECIINEGVLNNGQGLAIMNNATSLKRLQINNKKNFNKAVTFTNGLKLTEIHYTVNLGSWTFGRTNVFKVEDEQSEEVKKLLATIKPRVEADTCKCTFIYTKE